LSEPAGPLRVHGTLVLVADVGVLLLGKSGIGKSECALELVMRGHRLIADDIVLVCRGADGRPLGESHEMVRHYLELRGIGIVHVPSLFGAAAVGGGAPAAAPQAAIDLVVRLETWDAAEIERLGLDRRRAALAGVEVETLDLPVAPGRNIAALVEVAARNFSLTRGGRSGVAELDHRVTELLRRRAP
jgi:HPr kinase/phosphorylase